MGKSSRCDSCKLANKNPLIYLRSSRKVCVKCWQADKLTNKTLINILPEIIDKAPPLGYHFIINDYYLDSKKGKKYADHVYSKLSVCLS